MKSEIEHVSDTALMVAACRALESEREDGLVQDPFAQRLARDRGMAIARSVQFLDVMSFVVGLRARIMDGLILELVRSGQVETVANLGAGLDTRPWRLGVPPTLRWIEADFESILQYKDSLLDSEPPHCRLERFPVDLASSEARNLLFERVGQGRALMTTEGLLMYLPKAIFAAIAEDAPRLSGIQYWLLDAASTDTWRRITGGGGGRDWKDVMERLRPADHLAGQALLDAARESGWEVAAPRPYSLELAALPQTRLTKLRDALKQAGNTEMPRDEVSGVYLLKRTAATD